MTSQKFLAQVVFWASVVGLSGVLRAVPDADVWPDVTPEIW